MITVKSSFLLLPLAHHTSLLCMRFWYIMMKPAPKHLPPPFPFSSPARNFQMISSRDIVQNLLLVDGWFLDWIISYHTCFVYSKKGARKYFFCTSWCAAAEYRDNETISSLLVDLWLVTTDFHWYDLHFMDVQPADVTMLKLKLLYWTATTSKIDEGRHVNWYVLESHLELLLEAIKPCSKIQPVPRADAPFHCAPSVASPSPWTKEIRQPLHCLPKKYVSSRQSLNEKFHHI